MNRRIRNPIPFLAILVLFSAAIPLPGQTEEQIEEFNRQREAFFTERLSLTDQEAETFWPMYYDYFNRKMKLAEDERNTFKYCYKNAENLTHEEFAEALEKIRSLKGQQYKLEDEYYHEKFTEVLPPRKVIMLYKVEWDFRHHLLRQIRKRGEGGPDDRGRGGRSGGVRGPGPDWKQGGSDDIEKGPGATPAPGWKLGSAHDCGSGSSDGGARRPAPGWKLGGAHDCGTDAGPVSGWE